MVSGLVPSLLLYGNHSQLTKAVLSVLQQKLSSLSLSELTTSPAQVLCTHGLLVHIIIIYVSTIICTCKVFAPEILRSNIFIHIMCSIIANLILTHGLTYDVDDSYHQI